MPNKGKKRNNVSDNSATNDPDGKKPKKKKAKQKKSKPQSKYTKEGDKTGDITNVNKQLISTHLDNGDLKSVLQENMMNNMNQSSFSQDTNFYCPNPNNMFPSHSQSQQMCSTPNTGMIPMPMQHVSPQMLSTMQQRPQWVDELFSRIDRFENKLDHLNSKVTKLENTTKALDDRFCQIESSTQYISNEFETQKTSISNIKTEVDKLAKQLKNNHVNDEKLSKTIDQFKMLRAFGRKRVAPKERGDNMAPAAKKFVLRPSMDGDEGVWSRYIDGSIANTSFSSEVVSMTPISTTATFTEPITQSGITDAEEANSDRLMELTMVKGVTGFGSAANCGRLKVGDELVTVGGVNMSTMRHTEARDHLKFMNDGHVKLTVRIAP
ncbi:unnamed protein product [Mytilus edulis]|uniref:PDZ domain-containing protein n=1 Tax=Mytilus edulis TaxID=6550 RepID=A0A8S3PYS1_MYTED|nr:unnamed protein product [Mytilus edulis]